MKLLLSFSFIFFYVVATANDGAFYAKGNQLIPITETNISVKTEILSLKKINDKYIEVSVYYEFFNPGEAKEITVGFEAFSPSGDVDKKPINGLHPYMRDFTVNVNGTILPFTVAYVDDTLYNQNGKIKSISQKKVDKYSSQEEVGFFYVYHFKATFKKGLNIIKHTYNYNLSSSVSYHYDFEYVLSAANRWGNHRIDDFTLLMDMGEFETFNIDKTFFNNAADWFINGIGNSSGLKEGKHAVQETDALQFNLQKGSLMFEKRNFSPTGELFVYAPNYSFGEDTTYLPFSYYQQDQLSEPSNNWERLVYKNLPFARRGYIFQNAALQKYFEKMRWYIPNPNYIPNMEMLSETEKKWVAKWQ